MFIRNRLFILWLPKYFDDFFKLQNTNKDSTNVLNKLLNFFDYKKFKYNITVFHKEDFNKTTNLKGVEYKLNNNLIGNWIDIKITTDDGSFKVIFNEFGFYYFDFTNFNLDDESIKQNYIKEFYCNYKDKDDEDNKDKYPLLTDTQENILKETFLNDNLDHRNFNKKSQDKQAKIEEFILEAIYKIDNKNDIDMNENLFSSKLSKLQENRYILKDDEHYNFDFNIGKYDDVSKKIILDFYEEKAIANFLTTVVSAKYFDRITKSIKEVREGLTGKIIYMSPEDTKTIESNYFKNSVFTNWSSEKIEGYVQLLISKKPLFTKIDNALKSSYYIIIGNNSTLGYVNEREDISKLMYYNEWKALLTYFFETTDSLSDILRLYHSNRTFNELEEIKHYESNNHDKEDIIALIKSNENKLGITEDTKFILMVSTIIVSFFVAFPDMVGSVSSWLDGINIKPDDSFLDIIFKYFGIILLSLLFYGLVIFMPIYFLFKSEINHAIKIFKKYLKEKKSKIRYIKTSPDDFDLLEYRSNMPIESFDRVNKNLSKVTVSYLRHISIHRFVQYLEKLTISPNSTSTYKLLPEIITLNYQNEPYQKQKYDFFNKILQNKTTKFAINRIDRARIKINMKYRVNKIKLLDFLEYYQNWDSYIQFYKGFCDTNNNKEKNNSCLKINSNKVITTLKEDFKDLDAELSFVVIYTFFLISKSLDSNHEKEYNLYKNSYRIYYHIDKYPLNYYNKPFKERAINDNIDYNSIDLKPYDPISEMIYLVFLARLVSFNYKMKPKNDDKKSSQDSK